MKAQYGILRFKKYKGPAISPIEAHNERTKEQYASNPDIDTSRSRYNLHLVQPQGRYREEADRMIAAAHCRVRKDSVRVVEALVTASRSFSRIRPTGRSGRIRVCLGVSEKQAEHPNFYLGCCPHGRENAPSAPLLCAPDR